MALVHDHALICGYRRFNLMRASSVVNCQFTGFRAALRSLSHTATATPTWFFVFRRGLNPLPFFSFTLFLPRPAGPRSARIALDRPQVAHVEAVSGPGVQPEHPAGPHVAHVEPQARRPRRRDEQTDHQARPLADSDCPGAGHGGGIPATHHSLTARPPGGSKGTDLSHLTNLGVLAP